MLSSRLGWCSLLQYKKKVNKDMISNNLSNIWEPNNKPAGHQQWSKQKVYSMINFLSKKIGIKLNTMIYTCITIIIIIIIQTKKTKI